MEKIRAYVSYNQYNKTHNYREFILLDKLPELDDSYILGVTPPLTCDVKIESIEPVRLDVEQGNDLVYNYDYYEIKVSWQESDDEEEQSDTYYVCVEKEDSEDDE